MKYFAESLVNLVKKVKIVKKKNEKVIKKDMTRDLLKSLRINLN